MEAKELSLFDERHTWERPKGQLLKWVGNKYRFAEEITSTFPPFEGKYVEPFVGTGAILATVAPSNGIAGDVLKPLIEIWSLLQDDIDSLIGFYSQKWHDFMEDKESTYYETLESFNNEPNGLDLLFLCRSCYGGVVRFTKEGKMSTPIGPHRPINPNSFAKRAYAWRERVINTEFHHADYQETMKEVEPGDLVYCDPPYSDTQAILYGAQDFQLSELLNEIQRCKELGAYVALSIDGYKKSELKMIDLEIPEDLFERQLMLDGGSSMLRRFQKLGETMEDEMVGDRLLLTW